MTEGGVVPHRARRVKPRRRPRGTNVGCHDGQFVQPSMGHKETPVVYELNVLALRVYNTIADLKQLKSDCEARLNGPYHVMLFMLRLGIAELNEEVHLLRDLGYSIRKQIFRENGMALNEPLHWARDVNY